MGEKIFLAVLLLWNSIEDIRKKQISLCSIGIGAATWGALRMTEWQGQEWISFIGMRLIDILPGIVLCAVAIMSRGNIGIGDGLFIILTGLYIGFSRTVIALAVAFLIAFFWAIQLLVFRKKKKQEAFPFVPFLSCGVAAAIFIQ